MNWTWIIIVAILGVGWWAYQQYKKKKQDDDKDKE